MITPPAIQAYCNRYSSQPSLLLNTVEKGTEITGKMKMLSGNFLGQYLKMMSIVMQPRYILEVGTFTGYGTLCMLEGLHPEGKIITIEKDQQHADLSKSHFTSSHRKESIDLMVGDAAEILKDLDYNWDLVFIDAAKRQYIKYYELILPKLRMGGVILADNVLWKGKVVTEDMDRLGEGMHALNEHVYSDERVENIVLPIDDGVNFIIKK